MSYISFNDNNNNRTKEVILIEITAKITTSIIIM